MIKNALKSAAYAFEREKKNLSFCVSVTFLWGILAHAYGFLHGSFTHDTLREFYINSDTFALKISSGRFLVPVYRTIFQSGITLPWVAGILCMLYVGAALYFIIRIFKISSVWAKILVSGVLITNITVTSLAATYIHELDADMMALLLAVISAYIWHRNGRWYEMAAAGAVLAASLAIYQGYLSMTLTIMLFASIMFLLNGEKTKNVILRDLKGGAVILSGGIIYSVVNKAVTTLTGILPSNRTNPFVLGDIDCLKLFKDLCGAFIAKLIHGDAKYKILAACASVAVILTVLFVITRQMTRRKKNICCRGNFYRVAWRGSYIGLYIFYKLRTQFVCIFDGTRAMVH